MSGDWKEPEVTVWGVFVVVSVVVHDEYSVDGEKSESS